LSQKLLSQLRLLCSHKNIEFIRITLNFLIFGGIFFYFIYCPALNIPFAHHDQYRFFREDFHRPADFRKHHGYDSEYGFIRGIGRHIAAEIEFNTFRNVAVIKDLTLFRYITLAIIVISTTTIAVWLYYLGLPKYIAFLVSASIFTLPGIQNFVCMANIPNVLAILLGVTSSLILYQLRFLSITMFLRKEVINNFLILAQSFFLLLAALFCYPALAYLFLLPPLTLILFRKLEKWTDVRRVIALHFGVLGSASIVYLIAVKYLLSPTLAKVPGSYQFGLTHDIIGKTRWFIESVSVWALNLWNIYLRNEVALTVFLVICLGVIAKAFTFLRSEYFHRDRRKAVGNALQSVVAVIALVLAVNIPLLIMSGGLLLFRIILAYTAAIMVILFFSLKGLIEALARKWAKSMITIVFCIVFTGSAVYANFNVSNNALNSYSETSFISSQLAKYVNDDIKRIHVILPVSQGERYKNGYTGLPQITDEFNMVSLCHLHRIAEKVRAALLQVMDREKFVVIGCYKGQNIDEYLKTASYESIVVTFSETDEPVQLTPKTVVVNMNDLMRVSFDRNQTKTIHNLVAYTADSVSPKLKHQHFGAINAFDCNPNTFWETSGPFPHWIQKDFGIHQKNIKTYALQTGPSSHGVDGSDPTARMPKDWRLEGSNDGTCWTLLDTQTNQTTWKAGEIRTFNCNNPDTFRYYRLYISAGVNAEILRLYEIGMKE